MDSYLTKLKALYQQHRNPENAMPMQQYMRNQFTFLGIKSPAAKALFRQLSKSEGVPPIAELEDIVRTLWQWPEREYQYVALSLLDKRQKQLTPDFLPLLEDLVTTKSWWDTVDTIAIHNVGHLLKQYPDVRDAAIAPWRQSENIWLRRTAILFQLGYKTDTDEALLFAIAEENHSSEEFFIQKAIGWALREYSKTRPEAVKHFVKTTDLANLSRREALKWLKAKGQL